jgi:hypothetical protein
MITFAKETAGSIQYPVALVDDASIEAARTIRARSDSRYGNIYQEVTSDERWGGDLGEIVLDHWLTMKTFRPYGYRMTTPPGNTISIFRAS